ncbi:hypothetical protein ACFL6C_10045, partial [Myxococcota bacterium]
RDWFAGMVRDGMVCAFLRGKAMRGLLILGLLSVTMTGCEEAKGSPPPDCGSPGQVVWVDAAGQCVPGVIATSLLHTNRKDYIDEDGFVWYLEPLSGQVRPAQSGQYLYFESSDCTGTAYTTPEPPRVTFLVEGDDTVRTVPDNVELSDVETHYSLNGGGCGETSDSLVSVPKVPAALTVPDPPLEIPVLPYVFPIHPELVR